MTLKPSTVEDGLFHIVDQVGDQRFLARGELGPPLEHGHLLIGQFHQVTGRGEELRERDAEALADSVQGRDTGRSAAAEHIGNRGMG